MGYRKLYEIFKSASSDSSDKRTKEVSTVWELDGISDFNVLFLSSQKKGSLVIETFGNRYVVFVVDSVSFARRAPMAGGKLQVEATTQMHFVDDMDELKAPWNLPPYNFRISSAINEETASGFYPGDNDLWLEQDDELHPFVNSAGIMLEASASYATSQINFTYAISQDTFLKIQDWFWSLPGKINADRVTICGMTFPPRTIRLESMNAEYSEMTGASLTTGQLVNYHYYSVDVTLNANPRTWNQSFLNVGTHVRRGGAIARLWSWTNNGDVVFGTYNDYLNADAQDGQEVSEPVFLNAAGTNASDTGSDGRQIGTYRHGALFEPISFAALAFPSSLPKKWNSN